jgi:hypothetical protein
MNKTITTKRAIQCLENSDLQGVFHSKLPQFSEGNNVLETSASYTDGFY